MHNVGVKKTLYKIHNLYGLLQKCNRSKVLINRIDDRKAKPGFPSHINGLLHGEGICQKKTWHVVGCGVQWAPPRWINQC